MGDIEATGASCRMIANRTDSIVVSINYGLAPEHKFPTPVKDAFFGLEWVYERGTSFNGDVSRLAVGGDSVGGNLRTVVSIMASDRKGPDITAVLVLRGDRDLVVTAEMTQEIVQDLGKKAKFVELKDCGRSPLVDDLPQLLSEITQFLNSEVYH